MRAETLTSAEPAESRRGIIERFKEGRTRALVSVNMVTTGFNVRDVDLLLCMRPTKSPGLYVQMIGRGARVADGKTDCMVLDYAGLIQTHGPIDDVKPPAKKRGADTKRELTREEELEALSGTKRCFACGTTIPVACSECPECGQLILDIHRHVKLSEQAEIAPVVSFGAQKKEVTAVVKDLFFGVHVKEQGKFPTMMVEYWGHEEGKESKIDVLLSREFVCPEHHGFAAVKALEWVSEAFPREEVIASIGPIHEWTAQKLVHFCRSNRASMRKPSRVVISRAGKYPQMISKEYSSEKKTKTG